MTKTAVQLDAEIAEVLRAGDWKAYLAAVPYLRFKPADSQMWDAIREEGLDQEQEAPSHDQWVVAMLPISRTDVDGLRRFDAATIEKFNGFDIALKRAYGGKIIDLVDYEGGLVRLVKTAERMGARPLHWEQRYTKAEDLAVGDVVLSGSLPPYTAYEVLQIESAPRRRLRFQLVRLPDREHQQQRIFRPADTIAVPAQGGRHG